MIKKVLFISYFFPPIHSVESTTALNAVKYLKDYGWRPIVLASQNSREFGLDIQTKSLIPKDLTVVKTQSWENLFIRLLNRLGWVTDAMVGWLPSTLLVARRICKTERIEAIVSRSNPITSHLVAHRLIQRLRRPRLPWVALFGDPWAYNPYARQVSGFMKRWRERIERQIISDANAVVVTTQLTRQLLVSKYGLADKIYVLPNTYDPAEFGLLLNKIQPANGKLNITYAGTLYGRRSPKPLFKALQVIREQRPDVISDLQVNLMGSMPQFISLVTQYQLEDIVKCFGLLSREDTLNKLASSQILLLIDAPSDTPSIFLPAKLIEYLALGKPIIAITPAGTSADVIRTTKTGVVVSPESVTDLANTIIRHHQLYRSGQLMIQPNLAEVDKYTAPNYAERLSKILNGLTSQ